MNINTAKLNELIAVGFTPTAAAHIKHNRKMCGPFKSIDELGRCDEVKLKDIRKLRDKLEV